MAREHTKVEHFPAGKKEAEVKAEQQVRLANPDCKSCEYEGGESTGWRMTTVWLVPD